jgi:hypothetical protein
MRLLSRMTITSLLLAATLLGGCTVKTTIEVTATTPANVTNMYVTVKEVWFTSSSNATPGNNDWTKKVLSDPVTINLASLNDGTVEEIGSLTLFSGNYAQVRLVLADIDDPLTTSADDLGLTWNNAVQYVGEDGVSRLLPLEFASPDAALLTLASIDIDGSTALGSSDSATSTVVVDIDALRNLAIFDYGGQTAALLNPGLKAYNAADVGIVTGNVDLSAIASAVIDSDQGVVVSAEILDPDGIRHSIVKSTRLASDGSFTLYPLPLADGEDTGTYEIVVHGPGVETLVVTGVTVEAEETSELQDSDITLPASTSFLVNSSTSTYGGTVAGFYQTLPTSSRPYLIDFTGVNPFGGGFGADLGLATARVVYGAWNDGNIISFATATAGEGTASYRLAADSRWRAISDFVTMAGASGGSSTPQMVTLPASKLPAGAAAGTISGTITFNAAGQYDSLYLIVSRGGQIVDTVDLTSSITGGATVNFSVTNVPAGTTHSVYDLSVRAWRSGNPSATLARAAFTSRADLRLGNASGLSLQL